MDTLWKTNVTGLSVQAFMCMQTRREAKPEEVRKGSGVVANFLCNYAHTDAALGAVGFFNHDNFHSKRQTVAALAATATDREDHLHIVERADGRGLALRRVTIAPALNFQPAIMLDKDRAEARAVRRRDGEDWLVFFLCSFHVFSAMLEWVVSKTGLRDGTLLLALLCLFKHVARAQDTIEAWRRWEQVGKRTIRALGPHLGVHTVMVQGVAVVRERAESIIAYFEENWMAEFWLAAWTDIARALAGMLDFAGTNNVTERYVPSRRSRWRFSKATGCADSSSTTLITCAPSSCSGASTICSTT